MTVAQRGTPLAAGTIRLLKMLRTTLSIRRAAKEARVSRNTARKYLRPAF